MSDGEYGGVMFSSGYAKSRGYTDVGETVAGLVVEGGVRPVVVTLVVLEGVPPNPTWLAACFLRDEM